MWLVDAYGQKEWLRTRINDTQWDTKSVTENFRSTAENVVPAEAVATVAYLVAALPPNAGQITRKLPQLLNSPACNFPVRDLFVGQVGLRGGRAGGVVIQNRTGARPVQYIILVQNPALPAKMKSSVVSTECNLTHRMPY